MSVTETTTKFDFLSEEIRELVERILPAVVLIRNGNGDGGSGVRWSPDLVISNHHVVHSDSCRVVFHNGDEAPAQVLARDPENDLVALRIDGKAPALDQSLAIDLTRVTRIGEMAVAIGHPMGAEWAVTTGIVSRIPSDHQRRLLRASLTLLPGNSGGAMVNIDGDLIGINTMLTGPAEALAIPVDIVDAFARMALAEMAAGIQS